jgi:hypothetical protein
MGDSATGYDDNDYVSRPIVTVDDDNDINGDSATGNKVDDYGDGATGDNNDHDGDGDGDGDGMMGIGATGYDDDVDDDGDG